MTLDVLNNILDEVKAKSRKVTDTWSFKPTVDIDPGAQLENPDAVLSVQGIIKRHGYPCETHTIESQGYLLNVHRIPHSKSTVAVSSKTVILQHGLFCSSADWILNGPGKGLAYVLSDAGFDVWMPNVRGNRHSREHAWLQTDSKAYWNFSWHDVAFYDMPTIIDYIMKLKGEGTRITYMGHSMGTTILFAMLILRPEYNHILTAGFALAPVAFFTDFKNPLKKIAYFAKPIAQVEMIAGRYECIPKKSAIGSIIDIHNVNWFDVFIFKKIAFRYLGDNEKQFNGKLLPMFLANIATGTSWKTLLHYCQAVVSGGKFQHFDYGSSNKEIYGCEEPPQYDLSKVTLPLTLFWAKNDLLSSETDVKLLSERLPIKPEMYLVPDPKFNHMDYMWAADANELLNNKVLDYLANVYSN